MPEAAVRFVDVEPCHRGWRVVQSVGTMARGLDAGKYFWRSGREKCFSLDIPFYRTIPLLIFVRKNSQRQILLTEIEDVDNLSLGFLRLFLCLVLGELFGREFAGLHVAL